jgi:hypothetical protein
VFSLFNGIYNWDVWVLVRIKYLLSQMPIYRPNKLPLGRAYVWGHYLVILYSIEFIYAIYHVSKAINEVVQYPQSIVERHSLFEVDVVGVVSSPYT